MMTLFSATVAAALISAIWQGALLAACATVCLRLLPGISAAARSAIWMTVFAIAVALHFAPSSQTAASNTAELHASPIWSLLLAGTWLACSFFRGVQLVLGVIRIRQVNRRAVPLTHHVTGPTINRNYEVCISPDVDRPSVLGFFSPCVLLPVGLTEKLTPAELHHVLLHETEHLRRSDDWTNLLQKLALVLFPLNPALLYIERRLCEERELACDDRVLLAAGETTGIRKAYATCLTHLAEHVLLRRGLSLALGAWHRQSELTRRVQRILSPAERLMPAPAARFTATTLLLTLAAGGGILARSPRLISFTPVSYQGQSQNAALLPATFQTSTAAKPILTRAAVVEGAARPAMSWSNARRSARWVAARTKVRRRSEKRIAPQFAAAADHWSQPQVTFTLTAEQDLVPAPSSFQSAAQPSQLPQVQPIFVPAVLRVPVAYAAVRTPDGWIIFQL